MYRKYTNGLGKGRRCTKQYKKVNIRLDKKKQTNKQKTVMKGDFDSPAKLEVF